MPNLSKMVVSCLMAACFALCAIVGFYTLFSNFRAYDDEGVLLIANRLFLEGGLFYTDIPWIYGPGYLAAVRLFNDWLGVPLTHSAVRYTTLCYWLLLCTASGLLIYKLSRSVLWAITAFVLVFIFTQAIVNEPGHPQSLLATGAVLIPLAACYFRPGQQKFLWFFVGVLTAAIFHTKVNAGVFTFAAVAVVLLAHIPIGCWQKWLATMLVIGSFVFPFALMLPLLPEPNALSFAVIIAFGLASLALIVGRGGILDLDGRKASIAFIAGFSLITALAFLFAGVNGATPYDIFSSLFSYSTSQIEFYHFFREYSGFQLASAGASFALALWYRYSHNGNHRQWIVGLGKIYFVTLASYSIIVNDPAHAQAMLGYAGPWCWLLATGERLQLGRILLAAIAVWSPLLAYPIPGSQIYFGSLGILLAALVCSADSVAVVVARWNPVIAWKSLVIGRGIPLFVVLALFLILCLQFKQVRKEYYQFKPLNLPGTQLIRIEPRRGQVYREVVEELNGADVALTTFRFNSFYLWSSAEVAGSLYLAHSLAHSLPTEQVPIKAALMGAISPIVVKREAPGWAEVQQADILVWIEDNFESYRKIGRYTLMKPRGEHTVESE